MGVPSCNCVVAFARIVGTITGDATDLLVRRDLIEKIGKYGRISDAAARDLDRSYLECFLIDPPSQRMYHSPAGQWMWILRQRRRFGPPCLRAFHSPSPSALMPVLSTARQAMPASLRGDQKVQWPG
jgi:hypothetical protein